MFKGKEISTLRGGKTLALGLQEMSFSCYEMVTKFGIYAWLLCQQTRNVTFRIKAPEISSRLPCAHKLYWHPGLLLDGQGNATLS